MSSTIHALAEKISRPEGPRPAVLIAGPTASGKSALACAIAQRHGGVVINADSMQVYAALPRLTAQPTADELLMCPHLLYGHLRPTEICSAARWAELAKKELLSAWSMGQLPILVGGTGLYFRALLDGLSEIPDIAPEVRAEVRAMLSEQGARAVKAALLPLDPALAERLEDADGQRLARGLEVALSTGRALSDWQCDPIAPGFLAQNATATVCYVLSMERAELYERCNIRLDAMLAGGVLDEIADFAADDTMHPSPLEKAVGYPPLLASVQGQLKPDLALELAKRDTRRYAKRQMTWMRNQFGKWEAFSMKYCDN